MSKDAAAAPDGVECMSHRAEMKSKEDPKRTEDHWATEARTGHSSGSAMAIGGDGRNRFARETVLSLVDAPGSSCFY